MIRILCLLGLMPMLGLPKTVGSATVSDSTSFFSRGDLGGEGAAPSSRGRGTATGIDTIPRLDLALSWPRLRLDAGYAPRLVLADLTAAEDVRLLVMHTGNFSATFTGQRTRLALGQYFSVGEQYLGTLPAVTSRDALTVLDPSTSRAQLLATTGSLNWRSATTSAAINHAWTARWTSDFEGSYAISGGADAAARVLAPRFETFALGSALRYAFSERAELRARAASAHIDTSAGAAYWVTSVTGSWNMDWTPSLHSTLTAGAAWIERKREEGTRSASAAPDVAASLTRELAHRGLTLALRGGGSLAPFINALTAEIQTTMQGSLGAALKIEETELSLSLDGSRSLPLQAEDRFRVLGVGMGVSQRIGEWFAAYGQFRVLEQRVGTTARSIPPQWMVLAGAKFSPPTLDL